jgi:UDP-2,3-diacylglucosamine pyrophosphatase LpxH
MIYLVSDLHIGDGSKYDLFLPYKDKFIRFLDMVGTLNYLILVGDILELWNYDLGPIYKAHEDLIDRLLSSNIIIITGNHDEGLMGLPIPIFNSLTIGNFNILHGHQFDPFNSSNSIIGQILSISSKRNIKLEKWFSKATVYFRERGLEKMASKSPNFIIAGHTHKAKQLKNYINLGSWQGENTKTYYATIEDGTAKLHEFL